VWRWRFGLGGGSAWGTWGCYGLEGWWWINLVSERFADESYKGGGWCWLGVQVGGFVVFVLGDFFWRPLLLLGSIFVVASSCLSFGVDKVFRMCILSSWAFSFLIWLMFALPLRVSLVDRGEGCLYDLVLKSGGPITFDSRSGISSLAQVWGFLFFWSSFGGSEVERWWKLNDLSKRSFSDVARLWWGGLGVDFGWVFVFGMSSDDGCFQFQWSSSWRSLF
jgi:hypothetical protein